MTKPPTKPSNLVSMDARLTPAATIERLTAYSTAGGPPDVSLLAYDLCWAAQLDNSSLGNIQRHFAMCWDMVKRMREDQ